MISITRDQILWRLFVFVIKSLIQRKVKLNHALSAILNVEFFDVLLYLINIAKRIELKTVTAEIRQTTQKNVMQFRGT